MPLIPKKPKYLTNQEATALANSSSNQSRAWTLRRLADWKVDQISRTAESRIAIIRPLITVALAIFVLLFAGAMIGFLTHLIYVVA